MSHALGGGLELLEGGKIGQSLKDMKVANSVCSRLLGTARRAEQTGGTLREHLSLKITQTASLQGICSKYSCEGAAHSLIIRVLNFAAIQHLGLHRTQVSRSDTLTQPKISGVTNSAGFTSRVEKEVQIIGVCQPGEILCSVGVCVQSDDQCTLFGNNAGSNNVDTSAADGSTPRPWLGLRAVPGRGVKNHGQNNWQRFGAT
eukprot:1157452-Pelagomonas_calceolata.AAC.1